MASGIKKEDKVFILFPTAKIKGIVRGIPGDMLDVFYVRPGEIAVEQTETKNGNYISPCMRNTFFLKKHQVELI